MSDTKTVLITGSNRGIGLVFARHYAGQGWKVFAATRDVENAPDLKQVPVSKIIQLVVTDENSIAKAAEQLTNEPIDLLINNAGMSSSSKGLDVSKADLMKLFEVNAVGPLLVTKAFLPNLKLAAAKRGSAKVVQISSQRGSIAQNDTGAKYSYRTSKAVLNMVNASLAIDLIADKFTASRIRCDSPDGPQGRGDTRRERRRTDESPWRGEFGGQRQIPRLPRQHAALVNHQSTCC